MAWTASYTAAWMTAMSRKPTGPGRGADAVAIVFTAISFQSSTASARATWDQPNAASAITGTAGTLLSHLVERMPNMGFLPKWAGCDPLTPFEVVFRYAD